MTFSEFTDWFKAFDSTLGGKAPALPQWWELKARLDAVVGTTLETPSVRPAAPALVTPPAPRADVEDLAPSELTVYEEAVTLLRKRR